LITQKLKVNLIPSGVMPRLNVSQYDFGSRKLEISLYDGSTPFNVPEGANVVIQGTKKDNTGFQYEHLSFSDNVVYADLTQQMTVFEGETVTELVIIVLNEEDPDKNEQLATANFVLVVEPAALKDDIIVSETDIPEIQTLPEAMAEVRRAVLSTAADAIKTGKDADDAEAWAVGEIDGEPVPQDDPRYNNNAKTYALESEASAASIRGSVNDSEAWAVGTKGGVPVTQDDPQYNNYAKLYAENAGTSETNAAASEVNAGLSETNAKNSEEQAEAWAVGKINGTPVDSSAEQHNNNSEYWARYAEQVANIHIPQFYIDLATGELMSDTAAQGIRFFIDRTTGEFCSEIAV